MRTLKNFIIESFDFDSNNLSTKDQCVNVADDYKIDKGLAGKIYDTIENLYIDELKDTVDEDDIYSAESDEDLTEKLYYFRDIASDGIAGAEKQYRSMRKPYEKLMKNEKPAWVEKLKNVNGADLDGFIEQCFAAICLHTGDRLFDYYYERINFDEN